MIDIVEASYRVDQNTNAWLMGILDAARPRLEQGGGLVAGCYDARDLARFKVLSVVGAGFSMPMWKSAFRAAAARLSADEVRRTFATRTFGTVSEMLGDGFLDTNVFARAVALFGVNDGLGVNAIDPSGVGCVLGAWLPVRRSSPPGLCELMTYVSAHIAAGHRLRRSVEEAQRPRRSRRDSKDRGRPSATEYLLESAEAIMNPAGDVAHATEATKGIAERLMLRAAASSFDRARGRRRRSDPEGALLDWKALVAGRWSVVDCFDSDGRRFLVAHRNDPQPPDTTAPSGPLARLTLRERQVVGYAALGHANKVIAYDLGLSMSSVATHLVHAAAKLGASSRAELIAKACWRQPTAAAGS